MDEFGNFPENDDESKSLTPKNEAMMHLLRIYYARTGQSDLLILTPKNVDNAFALLTNGFAYLGIDPQQNEYRAFLSDLLSPELFADPEQDTEIAKLVSQTASPEQLALLFEGGLIKEEVLLAPDNRYRLQKTSGDLNKIEEIVAAINTIYKKYGGNTNVLFQDPYYVFDNAKHTAGVSLYLEDNRGKNVQITADDLQALNQTYARLEGGFPEQAESLFRSHRLEEPPFDNASYAEALAAAGIDVPQENIPESRSLPPHILVNLRDLSLDQNKMMRLDILAQTTPNIGGGMELF